MNKILLSIFAVGVLFAVGQALECYKCDIGIWDLCHTTKTTCKAGEHCFKGEGKTAGFIKLRMSGCLAVGKCNKTEDVTWGTNSSVYKMTKTCCNTELCNGASGLGQLGALPLALTTLATILIVKAMD